MQVDVLIGIEGGTILALAGFMIRVSFAAGKIKQRQEDDGREIEYLRNRFNEHEILHRNDQQHYRGDHGC